MATEVFKSARMGTTAKNIRDDMNKLLNRVRSIHRKALALHHAHKLNGAVMRQLDDVECWLEDARGAMTTFLAMGKMDNVF